MMQSQRAAVSCESGQLAARRIASMHPVPRRYTMSNHSSNAMLNLSRCTTCCVTLESCSNLPVRRMDWLPSSRPSCVHSLKEANAEDPPHVQTRPHCAQDRGRAVHGLRKERAHQPVDTPCSSCMQCVCTQGADSPKRILLIGPGGGILHSPPLPGSERGRSARAHAPEDA